MLLKQHHTERGGANCRGSRNKVRVGCTMETHNQHINLKEGTLHLVKYLAVNWEPVVIKKRRVRS